jgi:hypothetical protein
MTEGKYSVELCHPGGPFYGIEGVIRRRRRKAGRATPQSQPRRAGSGRYIMPIDAEPVGEGHRHASFTVRRRCTWIFADRNTTPQPTAAQPRAKEKVKRNSPTIASTCALEHSPNMLDVTKRRGLR